MYIPASNAEHRPGAMFDYMAAHPLATLVTSSGEGMIATHLPLLVDRTRGAHGTLAGHIARANPQQRQARDGDEALVIFSGHDTYITPAFYPSKARDGKVVPTWNYATVHAYGPLRAIEDAAWLRRFVEQLTDRHEAELPQAPGGVPWKVGDAPEGFIDGLLKAIVGIEIPLTRIEGKWKVSQNRPSEDRAGVVAGLVKAGGPSRHAMAELVRDRGRDRG